MTRRKDDCKPDQENHEQAKPSKVSSPDDGGEMLIDLDQERRERMQRNQQILQNLGLTPVVNSMRSTAAAAVEAKRAAPKRRQTDSNAAGGERVLRRSLRNQGKEPELPNVTVNFVRRPDQEAPYGEAAAKAARQRAPVADGGGGDAAKFDAHNLHRLRTMSDEAMLKRISKISNTLKLKSLVQLLQEFGRDELAGEAQAALDARLTNA